MCVRRQARENRRVRAMRPLVSGQWQWPAAWLMARQSTVDSRHSIVLDSPYVAKRGQTRPNAASGRARAALAWRRTKRTLNAVRERNREEKREKERRTEIESGRCERMAVRIGKVVGAATTLHRPLQAVQATSDQPSQAEPSQASQPVGRLGRPVGQSANPATAPRSAALRCAALRCALLRFASLLDAVLDRAAASTLHSS